jgi:hypothetical protein
MFLRSVTWLHGVISQKIRRLAKTAMLVICDLFTLKNKLIVLCVTLCTPFGYLRILCIQRIHLFIHSSMALQPFVGPWPILHLRNLIFTNGRTPWTSDQPVVRPLPTGQHKQNKRIDIHALSGIRTHGSSIRARENSSCLRPCGHCDRIVILKGRWREYLDRREMKWQEVGENYIMGGFITSTFLQV